MGEVITTLNQSQLPHWLGFGYGYCFGGGGGYGYGNYGFGGSGGFGYGYCFGGGGGYRGDGYGYGGYGGDGFGDGDNAFWVASVEWFAKKWPQKYRDRLAVLRSEGAEIAFWRSDADGRPTNGGQGDPVKPGDVQEVAGELRSSCGEGQLHATLRPMNWCGERWWIVALIGPVQHSDDKMWGLKREIIGECL